MMTFCSYPRKNNVNKFIVTPETKFRYKLPKTTYRCNLLPVIPSARGEMSDSAANEYGLAVTSTITAATTKKILALDP